MNSELQKVEINSFKVGIAVNLIMAIGGGTLQDKTAKKRIEDVIGDKSMEKH